MSDTAAAEREKKTRCTSSSREPWLAGWSLADTIHVGSGGHMYTLFMTMLEVDHWMERARSGYTDSSEE